MLNRPERWGVSLKSEEGQMWVRSKTVLWPALSVLSKCLRELAGGQNSRFVYQPGFWLEETIFGMKLLKGRNVLEVPSLASSIGA